ncbi:MAG: AAA family ATPase [bacterium]
MEAELFSNNGTPLSAACRLSPGQLRWKIDPATLPFESTQELEPAAVDFCQPRAARALTIGIRMKNSGHVFVCGPSGTDRKGLIEAVLSRSARPNGIPGDYLSTISFEEPWRPIWILLPPGKGRAFQEAVEETVRAGMELTQDLALPRSAAEQEADPEGDGLYRRCRQSLDLWLEDRAKALRLEYGEKETLQYLDAFLKSLQRDLERMLQVRLRPEPAAHACPGDGAFEEEPDLCSIYRPQLLLESAGKEVPIVFEPNPTFWNLFGYCVRPMDSGRSPRWAPVRFQPGSLLRANGGFLILDFEEVAREPGVWKHLKRCLEYNLLELPVSEQVMGNDGFLLRADPIPIQVKVIAWGDEVLFQDFCDKDPQFTKIFKFRADMDSHISRTEEHLRAYLGFLRHCCEKEGLPHFHRTGAAVFLEAGAELTGRQNKLSAQWEGLADLVREAAYWAQQEASDLVMDRHVEKCLRESRYRRNLPEEQIQEYIDDGSILIQTDGSVTGQVNGITLYDTEDYMFGKPCRITVQTALGRSGVINIEREANLSGKIHDKGVLILCGFLRDRYAQDKPLNLSASLCLEQCYTDIDGDSASLGEICGLLSSLAGVPLRQGIAVTGAISQKGEVLPVGGVNEKIAGFFELCRRRGLTGGQGVMIPRSNVQDLMLPRELVEAAEQEKFHLYAVNTVDEAMEILSGLPSGQRGPDGAYPPDTLNHLIDERLWHLSRTLRDFYAEEAEMEDEEEEGLFPPEGE